MKVTTARSALSDARGAGHALGAALHDPAGRAPDAVLVFASGRYDHLRLLGALVEASGTDRVIGCSSAGEFTDTQVREHSAVALGLHAPELRFSFGVGAAVSRDPQQAARDLVGGLGEEDAALPHRVVLLFADSLVGHTEALVQGIVALTGGRSPIIGGGAGDDARFSSTPVFVGLQARVDAAVALRIESPRPIGIGAANGWSPATGAWLHVTSTRNGGRDLVTLDDRPAVEAFQAHAEALGQRFDSMDPMPFFLHHVLGFEAPDGYRLRVPLGVGADGAVTLAVPMPDGAGTRVRFMGTAVDSTCDAAAVAARVATHTLSGSPVSLGLVFDCVATRLRMGCAVNDELAAIRGVLGAAPMLGCNTYGQIFYDPPNPAAFHNCTAVVCVL